MREVNGLKKTGKQQLTSICHAGLILFIALLSVGGEATAQDISVSAEVSPPIISLNETAVLRVTISGNTQLNKISPPDIGFPPELTVSFGGSASQYNLIGGKVAVSMTWSYVLRAQKAGKFTLPPTTLSYDGKTYQTNATTLEVLSIPQQEGSPTAPNTYTDSFYGGTHKVEVSVDNPSPYVNEQVIYTFRYLYTARAPSVQSPKYTLPSFAGFWEKPLAQQKNRREAVDGVPYWIAEVQVALFPMTAGKMALEPAKLSLPTSIGPETVLVTEPVSLDVRPLPQPGRPVNFNGVVGAYEIRAEVDRNILEAGSALMLRVELSGYGNLETLAAPVIPSLPGVTTYDPKVTDAFSERDRRVYGSRIYEYVLIFSQAGTQEIPAIEYPYFHPPTAQYKVARTIPITLNVKPGQAGTAEGNAQMGRSDTSFLEKDIRYIKPSALKLRDASIHPHKQVWFWIAQVTPIVAVLLAVGYRQRQSKRDPDQALRGRAAKDALRAISAAENEFHGDASAFFATLSVILHQYVGDILGSSVKGLSAEVLAQRCENAGISGSVAERLAAFLAECDYVRFAPSGSNTPSLKTGAQKAKMLIQRIEAARPSV